ncbi:fibrinogen alpha chain-like [Hemiscyllium ocellatum]|uniref:fibrinogen alpha chain-like n=1 Tax=Hemiscyllium ocellatum TaxID=170820 RepID=UPI002967482A|nr:fibrinogen alpha chain-like [Hemiscyllium ocellatum]
MKAILILGLILCSIGLTWAELAINPRGPRPEVVENRMKSRHYSEPSSPLCTDEEWGPKCPSGCRILGSIESWSRKNNDRIEKFQQYKNEYSKIFWDTQVTVIETANRMKKIVEQIGKIEDSCQEEMNPLNYKLIDLQKKVDDHIARENILKNNIIEQYKEISRLEVDIDIKLRACKGSCAKSFAYIIDENLNEEMKKNITSITSDSMENNLSEKLIASLKTGNTKDCAVDSKYKSFETKYVPETTLYPNVWEGANVRTLILEENTKDPSVSKTHPTSSSISTGSSHKVVSEFSHPDQNIFHSERSVTTKTIVSKQGEVTKTVTTEVDSGSYPLSVDELIEKYGLDGKTKGSTTTLTETHTSSHHVDDGLGSLLNSGVKSTGSKTVVHTKTYTSTGETGDFQNIGDFSTDFSTFRHEDHLGPLDGVSGSSKTISYESRSQHSSSVGGTKGFKATADSNHEVARLSEDETGGSDPGIKTF